MRSLSGYPLCGLEVEILRKHNQFKGLLERRGYASCEEGIGIHIGLIPGGDLMYFRPWTSPPDANSDSVHAAFEVSADRDFSNSKYLSCWQIWPVYEDSNQQYFLQTAVNVFVPIDQLDAQVDEAQDLSLVTVAPSP